MSRVATWAGLAGWLVLTYAAAALGALASVDAAAFYSQLSLPAWAPPAWLFGPVWAVLYTLMGIAAWLAWRERVELAVGGALALFCAQLVANALWTWLFFAWRRGALALVDILLLVVLVAATIAAFHRLRPLAAALLVPYLGWIGFAATLTWSVWRRNPQLLG
jgi:tryptophan-rich sensory protein